MTTLNGCSLIRVSLMSALLWGAACASGREASSDVSKTALERGEIVYGYVCERCHAFDTPSSYGPAMSGIVREYLSSHPDRATAARAMIRWIEEPSVRGALLPEHTIERLMLMPGQPLSPTDFEAVIAYVFDRYEEAAVAIRH